MSAFVVLLLVWLLFSDDRPHRRGGTIRFNGAQKNMKPPTRPPGDVDWKGRK